MANWTASQDDLAPDGGVNPRVETPNAAVYITFVHADGRTKTPDGDSVKRRVAFDPDMLNQPETFLAQKCTEYDALDERVARITASLSLRALAAGPMSLPDLSKQQAVQTAQTALVTKVSAALLQPGTLFTKDQIASAAAVDPTVTDAVAALDAALKV